MSDKFDILTGESLTWPDRHDWVVLLELNSDRKYFSSVKHGKLWTIVSFKHQALFLNKPYGTKIVQPG